MEMKYCMCCGSMLTTRTHPTDGPVPYCESCGDYRYPVFSTAVSMIVMNPEKSEMILIRQYGQDYDVLAAGYVDKGETAEKAVRRELMEELGLRVQTMQFLGSHYYEPSDTLMLNFLVTVEDRQAHPNWEVDSWRWFTVEEAKKSVRAGGLAETLLQDLDA